MLTDAKAAEMASELEELRARVRRLERRIDQLEPETVSSGGRGNITATPSQRPTGVSESPVIDAVADAFDALGFFGKS